MELQVQEIQALEPVKFNYEELKASLSEKVENYKNLVYTDENIKLAKTDRANLNKLSKAINDEKIRVKNLLLEPYTTFENQCKDLIAIVDEAVKNVDSQIKAYEQNIKDEKLKEIMNFFIENVGEYEQLIDFDKIYNEKWLNATYKMDQIQKDLLHIFAKTKTDLSVIDTQFTDENINKQVKMSYFNNIADVNVLTLAILDGNKIIENNKKIEELQQKEENSQNVTKSTENITNCPQNVTESEELQQLDFRVFVTQRQKFALKEFLKTNNIKFGPIPKN